MNASVPHEVRFELSIRLGVHVWRTVLSQLAYQCEGAVVEAELEVAGSGVRFEQRLGAWGANPRTCLPRTQ
jgi:hypothetical protein